MPFRDLLQRKNKSSQLPTNDVDQEDIYSEKDLESPRPRDQDHPAYQNDQNGSSQNGQDLRPPAMVRIMRSSTNSQEALAPPSFSPVAATAPQLPRTKEAERSLHLDPASPPAPVSPTAPKRSNTTGSTKTRRLSNLLHLNRRSKQAEPTIQEAPTVFPARPKEPTDQRKSEEVRQAQWQKRATLLVQDTTKPVSLPPSPMPWPDPTRPSNDIPRRSNENFSRPLRNPSIRSQQQSRNLAVAGDETRRTGSVGEARSISLEEQRDDDIQAAISLHEQGQLTTSTQMFGRLADPSGANNALAQVLYGLALRHGWGVTPKPDLAIQYLTHSARNASQLTSSLPSSSSPNSTPPLNLGELTLAIYELGNCHRNGWGVPKSPALAMQYFETAAELGDTDAMMEVAAGFEKGVKGWHDGKKDRFKAARWYRRAEGKGKKEVGNSWIWKDKYNEEGEVRLEGKRK